MKEQKLYFPKAGENKSYGYIGEIIDYTIENQLLDEETWKLFVNQFRIHSDTGNDWRGEYWGKMMRGGCLTYRATGNWKLYKILTATVKDLLSTQDELGRISSYPVENEFTHWDMWGRKYVMLGLLYYYDICRSQTLKRSIVRALKRHADYIVKHIGKGRGKKSIFDTSGHFGTMNSCSILEPFVKLYEITGVKRYFDFATYVVNSGCSKDFNLIDACLQGDLYPYQFKHTKAYEMMSCFEGILEYYKVTGEEKYLRAVENFVKMVAQTDYTIIGCCGCTHELFDNSTEKQTEPVSLNEPVWGRVMQETCVTVTFMKLCAKLLAQTGDVKYAQYIEKSGLNAMLGAVNNERQTMRYMLTIVGEDPVRYYPHEAYPFDSYSPLYHDRRGRKVGGFKELQDGRTYGCCACIGSAGTAIINLFAIMQGKDGVYVNLYAKQRYKTEINGKKTTIETFANPYKNNGAKLRIKSDDTFTLHLRIPEWAEDCKVYVNGEERKGVQSGEYYKITRSWKNDVVELTYKAPVKMRIKNGKIAFEKGAITLARDCRFEDIEIPVSIKVKDGKTVRVKEIENTAFHSNIAYQLKTKNGVITLCDYAQSGKNYDDERCNITVWQNINREVRE